MKRLLLILALCSPAYGQILAPILAGAPAAPSAFTHINDCHNNGTATPVTCTFSSLTASNYAYIGIFGQWLTTNPGVASITGAGSGGSCAQITSASKQHSGAASVNMVIWRCLIGTGSTGVLTVNYTGGLSDGVVVGSQFSGATGTDDAATPVGNQGNGTSATLGSFTQTTPASIIYACASDAFGGIGSDPIPGAPFTSAGADHTASFSAACAYRIETTSEAQTVTFTLGGTANWVTLVAAQH